MNPSNFYPWGADRADRAGDAWHGTFVDRVDPRRLLDDMVDTKVGKHQDPMAAAKMVSTHRDDI